MRLSWSWLGVIAAIGIGCGGGGGGTCPTASDISGLWSGSATKDDIARGENGTIAATITQSGCTLGGTWKFSFADPMLDKQLEVTGSPPQPTAVSISLDQCTGIAGACDTVATCTLQVTGTLVSASEISGTYVTGVNCSESETGSFDIMLQARLTPTPVIAATPVPTLRSPTAKPTP